MIANGGGLTHDEDPSAPAYTDDGAWAGGNSVLAEGSSWYYGDPWETAPIHLIQMMAPDVSEVGTWEASGYDCQTTWPGYERPAPDNTPVFYTWPGDGVKDAMASEDAEEFPFVPGDLVGLKEGTTTGPNMMVYAFGWSYIAVNSATLTGPDGAVEVRAVDHTFGQINYYMPPDGVFLIAVKPLKKNASYTASVTVRDQASGQTATHTWSFRTSPNGMPNLPKLPPPPKKPTTTASTTTKTTTVKPTPAPFDPNATVTALAIRNGVITVTTSGRAHLDFLLQKPFTTPGTFIRVDEVQADQAHAGRSSFLVKKLFPNAKPGGYELFVTTVGAHVGQTAPLSIAKPKTNKHRKHA
jgi:hypothetical protein